MLACSNPRRVAQSTSWPSPAEVRYRMFGSSAVCTKELRAMSMAADTPEPDRAAGTSRYDPDYVRRFYDAYGAREWGRFEPGPDNPRAPANLVNLHIHRWFLRRYIRPGDHVLDVGAGPGRFTIELARLGADVVVADISPGQLELNKERVAAAGLQERVVERSVADVPDLSPWDGRSFAAAVWFGGP